MKYNGGQTTIDEFRALPKEEQSEVIEYLMDFLVYEEIKVAGCGTNNSKGYFSLLSYWFIFLTIKKFDKLSKGFVGVATPAKNTADYTKSQGIETSVEKAKLDFEVN